MAVTPITGAQYGRDKTGLRRIEIPYQVDGPADHEGEEPYGTLDSWLPSSLPLGLPVTDRRAAKEDDGSWKLILVFEGQPAGEETEAVVEIDNAAVEEPIETFPKFQALAQKYKAKFDGVKFDGFQRQVENAGRQVQNPLYGTSHYVSGNVVLRKTWNTTQYETGYKQNLHKIDDPDVAAELKDLESGETWLKRSAKAVPKGNVWQYVVEWHSGRWAPDIYSPKA